MKLRTSFFNFTVFRKNITRFAPVWALYSIFMVLFLSGEVGTLPESFARGLIRSMGGFAVMNFFYAGVCAFYLFGDLFNSRLCNALHAFPMRREGWLLTNIASGVLFSFGPNLFVSLLSCVVLGEYSYVAFIWLAVSTLQFLFFFGTAVFSAVCAGNRLAVIAIYGIIHFITVLAYGIWELLYQPLLYGVQVNTEAFFKFFPLYRFVSVEYLDYVYTTYTSTRHEFYLMGAVPEGWGFLGLCAGVGVVSLALAWLVYRRRHLETAGDFISLRHLGPVFLYVYTIGVGMILYVFSTIFGDISDLFLVVGLIVGYFTGRMLLGRTLRVFHKKSFIGFAVLVILLAGSMGLTKLDPIGVSSRIPDINDVESVALYDSSKSYIYRSDFGYYCFEYTEEQDIAKVQDFHKQLLQAGDMGDAYDVEVQIRYTLKNGRKITRYYKVNPDSEIGSLAKKYFSDMRYLFQVNDPQMLDGWVYYVMAEGDREAETVKQIEFKDVEQITRLLDSIEADSKAGFLAQRWPRDSGNKYYLEFLLVDAATKDAQRHPSCSLYISEDCINTVAYLEAAFGQIK